MISVERLKELAAMRDQGSDTSYIPEVSDFSEVKTVFPATRAPASLTRHMCRMADIRPDMRVLEPSAGAGGMVDVIREFTPRIIAVEINAVLHKELQSRNCERTYRRDFLRIEPYSRNLSARHIPAELPQFDAVIMCPPANSDAHVAHAQRFLRPGGVLVALVQEQNIDRVLWPTYEPVDAKFRMGSTDIPCGIIRLEYDRGWV